MTKFRGFIAVEIPNSLKLTEFRQKLDGTEAKLKLVEPENMHFTLKFLGDTKEEQISEIENIITNVITGVQPFEIMLQGTGVFPNKNYIKIIWVGIQNGEELRQIAKNIDEGLQTLGFKKEKRAFAPHLTVARVKTAQNKQKLLQIIETYGDVEFNAITVDAVKLKKSDLTSKGPIYTTIKEVKLK